LRGLENGQLLALHLLVSQALAVDVEAQVVIGAALNVLENANAQCKINGDILNAPYHFPEVDHVQVEIAIFVLPCGPDDGFADLPQDEFQGELVLVGIQSETFKKCFFFKMANSLERKID